MFKRLKETTKAFEPQYRIKPKYFYSFPMFYIQKRILGIYITMKNIGPFWNTLEAEEALKIIKSGKELIQNKEGMK